MSLDKKKKQIKITILKLTVVNGETVKPGAIGEVDESDANRLINYGKAKAYETGDEKKYSYVSPKELAKKVKAKAGDKNPADDDAPKS